MFKKIIILTICTFITIIPVFNFDYSLAEDTSDSWIQCSSDVEVAGAIKAYCASRNNKSIFDNSVHGGLVPMFAIWNYSLWSTTANVLGFDFDQIQQNIKYKVSSDGTLQFLYDKSIISDLNSIFEQILQDYNIHENEEKVIYSGDVYTDFDNISTFIYHANFAVGNATTYNFSTLSEAVTEVGSNYKYDNRVLYQRRLNEGQDFSINFHVKDNITLSNTVTFLTNNSSSIIVYMGTDTYGTKYYSSTNANHIYNGKWFMQPVILEDTNNKLWLGQFGPIADNQYFRFFKYYEIQNANTYNTDISMNQGENKNDFEAGKNAAIDIGKIGADNALDALKDYIADDDPEEPKVDPDVPDDGNPDFKPSITPFGGIIPVGFVNNMPITIQLPNLGDLIPDSYPSIPSGMFLHGLSNKFPFCIPFDMIAVYEVLDQTPRAPHFETQISFCTFNYDLDIDLTEYDPYMVHIRNYFLILYIFGLLFITPKLLKA